MVTSFYQRSANHVSFYAVFNLRNLLYLILILVCVAIYAVLIQGIATGGDPIGAIWGCMGYSVLLCFCLFKTGSIARSVFSAH